MSQEQDSTSLAEQADSIKADSLAQLQSLLQDQLDQQRLDSLIQERLKTQLEAITGNDKKKKELEEQLLNLQVQDSLKRVTQKEKLKLLKQTTSGFPVAPFDDTLFTIYTKIGSFTSRDRAHAINGRLQALAETRQMSVDSIRTVPFENGYDIFYGSDLHIMSITAMDALWLDADNESLANSYAIAIRNELATEQEANSLNSWLKRIGMVVLIILLVGVIVIIINKVFSRSATWLKTNRQEYLGGIKFRNFQVLEPYQHLKAALFVNNALRIIIILFALYLSLPLLFSVFPETEVYTNTLLSWILTPAKSVVMGVLNFLPDLVTIIVIYFAFRYALRLIEYFFEEVRRGNLKIDGFYQDWAQPTFTIVKVFMYAFLLVIIFPYLPGSDSPAFQGVSVFLGILLSLGSTSAITNLIAGIVITYMRPFQLGDRIKIGDAVGDVIEKTMLVTRIRNIKNESITVPNSMVLSSHVVNYSRNTADLGLIIHSTVTIGYDVPWRDVHQALIDAALNTELVLSKPQPFVLQTSLDDFYISYQINAYTREANKQAAIYSNLHQNIQDQFNKLGIEIMSPHYQANRDGSDSTIPKSSIPEKGEDKPTGK